MYITFYKIISKEEPITPDGIRGFSCTNPINCLCRQKIKDANICFVV